MDKAPIFEHLTAGWVDDNVGLFFLLNKLAEVVNITQFGAALPTVLGRRKGTRQHVIA